MEFHESTVVIDDGPGAVRAVLIDGASYPEWDSGSPRWTARSSTAGGSACTRPSARAGPSRCASRSARPHRMSWTGGIPPGLFRGHRTSTVADEGLATRRTVREECTGLLRRPIWRSVPDLGPSFAQFTRGVKARVEGQRPPA